MLAFPKQVRIFWPLNTPRQWPRLKINWQWRKLVRNLIYLKTISKPWAGRFVAMSWLDWVSGCSNSVMLKNILNSCIVYLWEKLYTLGFQPKQVLKKLVNWKFVHTPSLYTHCPYRWVNQVKIYMLTNWKPVVHFPVTFFSASN